MAMAEQVPSFVLTQTQPMATQKMPAPQQAVLARLISTTDMGFKFELRKDIQQVHIGRHPDCEINVTDKRVSSFHARIYRDEALHYFIEGMSANGCFVNETLVKKGDTRVLHHGDEISLCVYAHDENVEPFAVYIFRVASHESESSVHGDDAFVAAPTSAGASLTAGAAYEPDTATTRQVTEQWVHDRWDTRTVLGRGNFSEVRLGVRVQDGTVKRAVKMIDKKKFIQFQKKRESGLSLSSEASVLESLHHPGIVKCYDWFETEMHFFLVMEFVEGGDLLQCLMSQGCFTESQARGAFRQLCDAVWYLHHRNIVHRDLKPENILLTTCDRNIMQLKLADFGLARLNMKSKDCRTFCGTPHYFAPEVINTFRDRDSDANAGYGKPVDMWSLGVILYILLSGIPPFEEEGLYEQILEANFEFDATEWIAVSPEAKDLVTRLMTVNPRERFTIEQACNYKWFCKGVSVCNSSPVRKRISQAEIHEPLMGLAQVGQEPVSKRRRANSDGMMPDGKMLQGCSVAGA